MNLSLEQKRDILTEIAAKDEELTVWAGGIGPPVESLSNFLINSGWYSDFNQNQLTVISNTSYEMILPYPVFYNKQAYTCILGASDSYITSRIMNLRHPLIPDHIKIVANGRVHFLIETVNSIRYAYTSDTNDQMLKQIQDFIKYASAFGFIVNINEFLIITRSCVEQLVYLHRYLCIRYFINANVNFNDVLISARKTFYHISKHKDEFTLPQVDTKDYQEYKIDEITSVDQVKDWISSVLEGSSPATFQFYEYLDMIMSLASKNLLPDYGIRFLDVLVAIFCQNLTIFGYARTPINFYMTANEEIKYLSTIINGEYDILLRYQQDYNNYVSRGVMQATNATFDYKITPIYAKHIKLPVIFRSGKQLDEVSLVRPETKVPGTIIINNLEFNRQDLIDLFFETPLAQIATFEGDKIDKPIWLTQNDLQLIHGFINGLVMPLVLYKNLSKPAYDNLSYQRSLLYNFDNIDFRYQLSTAYKYETKPNLNSIHSISSINSMGRNIKLGILSLLGKQ